MFHFQLKQSFLDYFGLSNVNMLVNSTDISDFICEEIENSKTPHRRAIEIWNTFVEPTEDFFDSKHWLTREKLEECKQHVFNPKERFDIYRPWACVGCAPFCDRPLPSITEFHKQKSATSQN